MYKMNQITKANTKNDSESTSNRTTVYNIQLPNPGAQSSGSVITVTQSQSNQVTAGENEIQVTLAIRTPAALNTGINECPNVNCNLSKSNDNFIPVSQRFQEAKGNCNNTQCVTQSSSLQYVPSREISDEPWTATPPQAPNDWQNNFAQLRKQWSDYSKRNPLWPCSDPARQGSQDHLQPCYPTSGEVRAMFGTNAISDRPEYAVPTTMRDPSDWRPRFMGRASLENQLQHSQNSSMEFSDESLQNSHYKQIKSSLHLLHEKLSKKIDEIPERLLDSHNKNYTPVKKENGNLNMSQHSPLVLEHPRRISFSHNVSHPKKKVNEPANSVSNKSKQDESVKKKSEDQNDRIPSNKGNIFEHNHGRIDEMHSLNIPVSKKYNKIYRSPNSKPSSSPEVKQLSSGESLEDLSVYSESNAQSNMLGINDISDEDAKHILSAVYSIKKISNSSRILEELHNAFESSLSKAGMLCLPQMVSKQISCRGQCCTANWSCFNQSDEHGESNSPVSEQYSKERRESSQPSIVNIRESINYDKLNKNRSNVSNVRIDGSKLYSNEMKEQNSDSTELNLKNNEQVNSYKTTDHSEKSHIKYQDGQISGTPNILDISNVSSTSGMVYQDTESGTAVDNRNIHETSNSQESNTEQYHSVSNASIDTYTKLYGDRK